MSSITPETLATSDFDLFGREAIGDAQKYDGMLRELGPVVYMSEYDIWVTGRHSAAQAMLSDWETFSSRSRPFHDPNSTRPEILLVDDPPRHTNIKNIIHRTMTPGAMRRMQETFQAEADRQVDALLADGPVELDARNELVAPYILKVFPDILGLPEEGRHYLMDYGNVVFNTFGPENELFHDTLNKAGPVLDWVEHQCKREAIYPEGIAAQMYDAADEGEVTYDEAELLVKVLLSAGSDSTIVGITTGLRALSEFPEEWAKLKADPSRARSVLEEAIRWDSITRMLGRVVTRDVEIEGVTIPEGAKIGTLMVAVGRDPRRWDAPDKFDLDRKIAGHMSFGHGAHSCVGQAVARLEAECLFNALARKVDRIERTGETSPVVNNVLHGTARMPIRLHPAKH